MAQFGPFLDPLAQNRGYPGFQEWIKYVGWDVLAQDPPWIQLIQLFRTTRRQKPGFSPFLAQFWPFLGPLAQNWGYPEFQNWFKMVSWDVLGLYPPWIYTDPAILDRQTPKTWLFPVFGQILLIFGRFWALEVLKFLNEA